MHGALATVAWAVLVPLGVMAARYLRKLHPYWFLVHQTLQLSAFALGLVAFNLGWALPPSAHSARAHGALGVIIMLLSTLQVGPPSTPQMALRTSQAPSTGPGRGPRQRPWALADDDLWPMGNACNFLLVGGAGVGVLVAAR